MGGVFSSSSTEETHNNIDSSSNSTIPTDSQNPGSLNSNMSDPDSKTLDQEKPLEDSKQQSAKQEQEKPLEDSKRSEKEASENAEEEEEEEEGECGFCLFMKGGGCKESFVAWEKCIEEAEKNKEDIVDKCADITGALKKCMEAHPDYYEPILRAEKVAEDEAIKELEKEKEKEKEQEQEQEQKIASN